MLSREQLLLISHVLESADSRVTPYEDAKAELIRTLTSSPLEQARRILTVQPLGDMKPSAMYKQMMSELPEDQTNNILFKYAFFQRLPEKIRAATARLFNKSTTEELAEEADNVWSAEQSGAANTMLPAPVAALPPTGAKTGGGKGSRKRRGDGGGQQQPNKKRKGGYVCHNHFKYGDEAWNCSDTRCEKAGSGNGKAGEQ